MVNEIKLDKVSALVVPVKASTQTNGQSNADISQGAVTVTNNLNKLISLLSTENSMPDESARVAQMKQRIQNDDYQIDHHALSQKLLSSGVLQSAIGD